MKTILFFFFFSFFLALILTPLIRDLAIRYKLMDMPSQRKRHDQPVPRLGGLALFTSFILSLATAVYFSEFMPASIDMEENIIYFLLGAGLIFSIGILDDLRSLNPWVKLFGQIAATAVACGLGDICIRTIAWPVGGALDLGWLSLPVTMFWFLIIINAINLVDGLDGLAGGIVFFASLVLMMLCIMNGNYIVALWLSMVAGSCLGFLRYNFNPATIFMGDGGSYFLGYLMASLSIMGFIKGQTAVAFVIPLVALGLPIFDTLLAPVRRFIRGRSMFRPDRGHFHYRLLAMGMTTRKAVTICYGATILLGVAALFMVHMSSERAAILLLFLGAVGVVTIRKLGYLDYFTSEKVGGWLRDITDAAGFGQEQRSFLDIQMLIAKAQNIDELWELTGKALIKMDLDQALLHIKGHGSMHWIRQGYDPSDTTPTFLMRMELPLVSGKQKQPYGKLILFKDLRKEPLSHYTLRRMEHLRRNITGVLPNIHQK